MDSKSNFIKEISIVSHCNKKDGYDDLLRISKHWISYRRTNKKGKEIHQWSYKTSAYVLEGKYNDVTDCLYREFKKPHPPYNGDSLYDFIIRITYRDDTYEDIHKKGTFSDNDMCLHAAKIYKIIPENEAFPDVITVFKSEYLNSNNFSKIRPRDINAFMYAESGAMGFPGCIDLITSKYQRYYTDGIYGKLTDVSQYDVASVLDGFEHKPTYQRKSLEILKINNENWIYLNLGAGNHLFLRHDMYYEFGNMLVDVNRPNMFGKWRRLVDSKTIEPKCNTIEIEDDALNNDCDILCHQVNLEGVMDEGIGLSIAKKYPDVEKEYIGYPNKSLGEVCFANAGEYVIANCFSQTESNEIDYESLRTCLDKVVEYMIEKHLRTVAIPYKYGCEISNGDWEVVKSIFEEKLKDYTLVIHKSNV